MLGILFMVVRIHLFKLICFDVKFKIKDSKFKFPQFFLLKLILHISKVAYARDLAYRQRVSLDPSRENFGIPQQFGMYYALGIGLIVEGNYFNL